MPLRLSLRRQGKAGGRYPGEFGAVWIPTYQSVRELLLGWSAARRTPPAFTGAGSRAPV